MPTLAELQEQQARDGQIKAFVEQNIRNPQMIAQAAFQYGVKPADIARATGYSPGQIAGYFKNAGIGSDFKPLRGSASTGPAKVTDVKPTESFDKYLGRLGYRYEEDNNQWRSQDPDAPTLHRGSETFENLEKAHKNSALFFGSNGVSIDPTINGKQYRNIGGFANNDPDGVKALQVEIDHLKKYGIEPINHPVFGWVVPDDEAFHKAHPDQEDNWFDKMLGVVLPGLIMGGMGAGLFAGISGVVSSLGGAGAGASAAEFAAADAAQLAGQGLSQSQIAQTLQFSGMSAETAAQAASMASQGMTVEAIQQAMQTQFPGFEYNPLGYEANVFPGSNTVTNEWAVSPDGNEFLAQPTGGEELPPDITSPRGDIIGAPPDGGLPPDITSPGGDLLDFPPPDGGGIPLPGGTGGIPGGEDFPPDITSHGGDILDFPPPVPVPGGGGGLPDWLAGPGGLFPGLTSSTLGTLLSTGLGIYGANQQDNAYGNIAGLQAQNYADAQRAYYDAVGRQTDAYGNATDAYNKRNEMTDRAFQEGLNRYDQYQNLSGQAWLAQMDRYGKNVENSQAAFGQQTDQYNNLIDLQKQAYSDQKDAYADRVAGQKGAYETSLDLFGQQNKQQMDAYGDRKAYYDAERARLTGLGDPYRGRLEALYNDPESFLTSKEVQVPVQQATNIMARSLSMGGNPVGSGNALQQLQSYSADQLFGKLGEEKGRLAKFGGLEGAAYQSPAAPTGPTPLQSIPQLQDVGGAPAPNYSQAFPQWQNPGGMPGIPEQPSVPNLASPGQFPTMPNPPQYPTAQYSGLQGQAGANTNMYNAIGSGISGLLNPQTNWNAFFNSLTPAQRAQFTQPAIQPGSGAGATPTTGSTGSAAILPQTGNTGMAPTTAGQSTINARQLGLMTGNQEPPTPGSLDELALKQQKFIPQPKPVVDTSRADTSRYWFGNPAFPRG